MKQLIGIGTILLVVLLFSGTAFADGRCYSDSDCGAGVKCNNNICATSEGGRCNGDSECGPGVKCNSNKCATAPDGKCYGDSDCGGGKCNSNKCSGGFLYLSDI